MGRQCASCGAPGDVTPVPDLNAYVCVYTKVDLGGLDRQRVSARRMPAETTSPHGGSTCLTHPPEIGLTMGGHADALAKSSLSELLKHQHQTSSMFCS